MTNIYFNLTDVLVECDKQVCERNIKNNHFNNTKPNDRMINVITHMINKYTSFTDIQIFILTSLSNNIKIFIEQYDKEISWLKKYIPDFRIDHFHPILGTKLKTAILLKPEKINKTNILIDTNDDSLKEWKNAGATAIKYLNNINIKNYWNGLFIDNKASSKDIVKMLEILSNIK